MWPFCYHQALKGLSTNGSITRRKKCLNTGFFLVLIFPYSEWILRPTEESSVFITNSGKQEFGKTRTKKITQTFSSQYSFSGNLRVRDEISMMRHIHDFLEKRKNIQFKKPLLDIFVDNDLNKLKTEEKINKNSGFLNY